MFGRATPERGMTETAQRREVSPVRGPAFKNRTRERTGPVEMTGLGGDRLERCLR